MKNRISFKPDPRNLALNISEENLIDYVYGVELSRQVPASITQAMNIARQVIQYSYYTYELYTVAAIHLYLIVESAVKDRLFRELPATCMLTRRGKTEMLQKDYAQVFARLRDGWQIVGYEKLGYSLVSIIRWFIDQKLLPGRIGDREIDLFHQINMIVVDVSRREAISPGILIPFYWKVVDFINCLYDLRTHDHEPPMLQTLREQYTMLSRAVKKLKKPVKSSDS